MSVWPILTLAEAGVQLIDCVHKTPSAQSEGYPYVGIPQMKDGRLDFTTSRRISSADYVEWTRKARPQRYDIVLSRRTNPGVAVQFRDPPEDWRALVSALGRTLTPGDSKTVRRLRVLVVGDEKRQRGALALYVTSGWDVRFATNLDTTVEALTGAIVDAVIAEHDAADPRWHDVLSETTALQPSARRIVRGAPDGPIPGPPLVHRFVDRDAGLDALLDALTADLGV